ncbi:histone deacetylase family protein [Sandaracinobacteroides hominis]|uniref:histone deacetylase family protein n=1 Tax=Sandaracinobacteroides hominis TaxID=2780086 RepID=UPI0018F7801C|nr:histone deacetylase [Sandaracinobacteroides hominis]
MRFFFHPAYVAPLPDGHSFPMSKYETTREALTRAGVLFEEPAIATREMLIRVHAEAYADAVIAAGVPKEIERRIGFPVTPAVSLRSRLSVGGTWAAARAALADGFAANVAGGSHHAMPDGGAGYCVLNDLAVTAAGLLAEGLVQRLLILDLDVHQGDGTAVCLAGWPAAFTFSLHAERNFPVRKARSGRDVELADGMADAEYLDVLAAELPGLFDVARPQIVLVQAGVDPHVDDRLGRLALTDAGLQARDRMVREACLRAGVPFAVTLGGGYDRDVVRLGERHAASLLSLAGHYVAAE